VLKQARTIPVFDVGGDNARFAPELTAAMRRVIDSGRLILGPEVEAFESEVALALGVEHAVGVSSGTDALIAALLTLGIGAGDEVITTAFSFVATAEAIVRVGARPRFGDIDPSTYNLDPDAVSPLVTSRTRALIVPHLFGQSAALRALGALAEQHGIALIEDAAQAFGGRWQDQRLGTVGTLGCFSFFPTKPLGALGDGGLVVTNDAALAARCRAVRAHGAAGKHRHVMIGGNFRLDAVQAACLRIKLPAGAADRASRAAHAEAYGAGLADIAELSVPNADEGCAWSLYTLRVPHCRDELAGFLRELGIETAVHYPVPLHLQPCLAEYGDGVGSLPHSERAAEEVLSVPLFPTLERQQRDAVVAAIREFFRAGRRRRAH
jgi:dTDP-4-amino-4,6-dideoxygalactose transaminase